MSSRFFWLCLLLAILIACKRVALDVQPEASFTITPNTAKTTDTLRFNASASVSGANSQHLYYRWDWETDGVFDTEYERTSNAKFRYYTPGTHTALLEVINSSGRRDTTFQSIVIEQGYSAPHAGFRIEPATGSFITTFLFDGRVSIDDEDSLSQLLFRWDLDGNSTWDTRYKSDPTLGHRFEEPGYYSIGLQVQDPLGLTSAVYQSVEVHNKNPDLVANFEWTPEYGTTADTFLFDASSSYMKDDPFATLFYSWKFPPVYVWTAWDTLPTMCAMFEYEKPYPVELRIRDTNYLEAEIHKEITIYHENLPPDPTFRIGCERGNIRTQFYFNAWDTRDVESTPTELKIRWDFDGDGHYETGYDYGKEIYHQYDAPGTYKVVLEAADPTGLSDTTSQYVFVSPYTNETGLIFDFRDEQTYGTVKIGDQWWMSENLNFAPWDPNKDYVTRQCYRRFPYDPIPWCSIVGGLYNIYHATRNGWWHDDVKGICPLGWHMPTKMEWEELIENIGGWNSSEKLILGGETDFNAKFAGFGETRTYTNAQGEAETGDFFQGLGEITYFWSFKQLSGWPIAQSCWNIALLRGDDKIYPGYSGNSLYLSVRCIKDEE